MQPKQIVLPVKCSLELAHTGFVIGAVYGFFLGVDAMREALPSLLNLKLPVELHGDYLIGQATFFNSALADKAWEGLVCGIFTHTCPVIWQPAGAPAGTGMLVQTSLVPGDYPGCPNARVLGRSG